MTGVTVQDAVADQVGATDLDSATGETVMTPAVVTGQVATIGQDAQMGWDGVTGQGKASG